MHPAPTSSAPPATWTILEVLRWTTGRFERNGIPSARLDAELLAAQAFGRSRVELYTHFDQPLGEDELGQLRELVRRRLAGEPVAYLLGRKEFWSLALNVDARVLIPRPETETLVERALLALPAQESKRVADIGTGSGAVALALKKERPGAEVVAVDISADALAVARENASRLGLDVIFLQGDLVQPLVGLDPFDLIVSNPPYIRREDIDGLAAEVRCEPRLALDGGEDGLALVRGLATAALPVLAPGGTLAMEIGAGQAAAVMEFMRSAGYAEVGVHCDLAGIERVVFGQRQRQGEERSP